MTRGLAALLLVASPSAVAGPALADERDDGVEVRVAGELTVTAGDAAALSVTIVPAAGRTVSADGPVSLTLATDDGLALARRRYGRRDAADPAAEAPRFDVRLRGKTAGDHALALAVKLWLCGAKLCRPLRLERTVVVHVTAPAPAP